MTFLTPAWFLLILPLAALVAAYVVLQQRRRHHAVRFTNVDLLSRLAPTRAGWRRHVAAAAAMIGIASLVVALARPARDEAVPRDEATVMLVVDVSASMEATDVAPSRIDAARSAAADFVDGLPDTYQVGLVAFDGTARVVAPPTDDHDEVIVAIDGLQTGPGTATGDGVAVALDSIAASTAQIDASTNTTDSASADEVDTATVVVLSDGVTTAGQSLDVATAEAVDQGVPVTTIAYGTASGSVTVEGQQISVPADEASLAALAEATGGTAFTAASADELASVYDSIQSRIGTVVEQREVLRFFVGFSIVALMAAVAASMFWNGRFL